MTDGTEDCVNSVALGSSEVVSFKVAILLEMADHGFDCTSSSHFTADGRRCDTPCLRDGDVEVITFDLVTAVSLVSVNPFHAHTGQFGDLINLSGQRVTVIRRTWQGHGAEDKLPTFAALVGGGDGCLDAELVAGACLTFSYTFNLWRMQGIELVLVTGLLAVDFSSPLQRNAESSLKFRGPCDFALDVPDQSPKPGTHLADPAQALLVTAGMEKSTHLTPGTGGQPNEGLAQFDPVTLGHPI